MIAGFALILGAAGLYTYNSWDENRASAAALNTAEMLLAQIGDDRNIPPANSAERPMKSVEIDGESYIGVLSIPALDLSLPIIKEWSYARLKVSPCRFVGSCHNDNLIIAAHNYKQHFGNISLLQTGDAVTFVDVDGNQFNYEVAEIETLESTQVDDMVANDFDLTLFTCTYGGAARVTVRCDRVL